MNCHKNEKLRLATWVGTVLLLGLPAGIVGSQEPAGETDDEIEIVQIRTQPSPEADPPLRHSLLTPYPQLEPGNAAIFYYRALVLMPRDEKSQFSDAQEAWLELPVAEMPQDEVQKWLAPYQQSLYELQRAAVRETCNWGLQLRDLDGLEAIMFQLPELQEVRQLARMLRLKSRLELAQRRFDDALNTLRLGYSMARDVGRAPTLIHGLVGIAIGSQMNQSVVDWVRAGGPNLYWALTMLPDPLVDLRIALQQEMNLPVQILPFLEDPEGKDWSDEQWRDALAEGLDRLSKVSGEVFPDVEGKVSRRLLTRMAAVGWLLKFYPQVKQALIDSGMDKERVDAMPVGQVVAIQVSRTYRHIYDHTFKWSFVPVWQAREGSSASQRRLREEGYLAGGLGSKEIIPIAGMMMPAVRSAMFAAARLDRDIAALRTIEGLRAYAASHNGRWPKQLQDVQQTPIPLDPITGQLFPFEVREGRGELLLSPQPGIRNLPGRRYQIEFQTP
jgi:hypothetical protein